MDLLKLTGQELLINRLKNEFIKGYLPHSQLFVDSSGYGALPLVLSLCQSLIAHGNEAIATAVLEHPDVHFYYPTPSNTKSQKIDLPSSGGHFVLTVHLVLFMIGFGISILATNRVPFV